MPQLSTYATDSDLAQEFQRLSGAREILSANRTYYVRPDGNDSNDGLANTAEGAFLTIIGACTHIGSTLDVPTGIIVTIQVASGTYVETAAIQLPVFGGGSGHLKGDETTPGNVIIRPGGGLGAVISINGPTCRWKISGFYIDGVNIINYGSVVDVSRGTLTIGKNEFRGNSGTNIFLIYDRASLVFDYTTITVRGTSFKRFTYATNHSEINFQVATIAFPENPTVVSATAYSDYHSVIIFYYGATSGTVTGRRFSVYDQSMIDSYGSGASYIPGSTAGVTDTATGGLYL